MGTQVPVAKLSYSGLRSREPFSLAFAVVEGATSAGGCGLVSGIETAVAASGLVEVAGATEFAFPGVFRVERVPSAQATRATATTATPATAMARRCDDFSGAALMAVIVLGTGSSR